MVLKRLSELKKKYKHHLFALAQAMLVGYNFPYGKHIQNRKTLYSLVVLPWGRRCRCQQCRWPGWSSWRHLQHCRADWQMSSRCRWGTGSALAHQLKNWTLKNWRPARRPSHRGPQGEKCERGFYPGLGQWHSPAVVTPHPPFHPNQVKHLIQNPNILTHTYTDDKILYKVYWTGFPQHTIAFNRPQVIQKQDPTGW